MILVSHVLCVTVDAISHDLLAAEARHGGQAAKHGCGFGLLLSRVLSAKENTIVADFRA